MIIVSVNNYDKISKIETYLLKVCGFVWENMVKNVSILSNKIDEDRFNENNGLYITINNNIMNWNYSLSYRNNDMEIKPIQIITDKRIFKEPEKCKTQLLQHS